MQPRSTITCVGWWASTKGTDATHAVCLELYHAAAELEELSVKLEYPSSNSKGMAVTFFITGCFRGCKSKLRTSTFLVLAFLVLASASVRDELIAWTLFWWVIANGLDCHVYSLSSHAQKHDPSSSIFHCSPVNSFLAYCPNSSSTKSSTMKVLLVLPPCLYTRSEGFSIQLSGEQNNSTNTVLNASNV